MPDLDRYEPREHDGRLLVSCDEQCGAYAEPSLDSLEELRAALRHWEWHGNLSGCSHAC